MLLKRNTFLLFVVLCAVILQSQSVSAGSSFLSPSQKPQSQHKGKSYRVGRQVLEEHSQPTEDNHVTISAPFEIGITIGEEDFQEYGLVLQEMIQRLMGKSATERP